MAIYNSAIKQKLPSIDAIFSDNSLKYRNIVKLQYSDELYCDYGNDCVSLSFFIDYNEVQKFKYGRYYVEVDSYDDNTYHSKFIFSYLIWNSYGSWSHTNTLYLPQRFEYKGLFHKAEDFMWDDEKHLYHAKKCSLHIELTNYINGEQQ